MSTVRILKKGEYLFREGEKNLNLFIIQSGGLNLCLIRPKKNIELFQLGPNQILGEATLSSQSPHTYSAIATTETKLLEIPIDSMKATIEQSQMIKLFLKSLSERLKIAISDVKSSRMEKDSSPCPEDQVAKIFGAVFHTANHKGEKGNLDNNQCSIDWVLMKQYAQRVFNESPKRLEQAICILSKRGQAQMSFGKLPEDPDGPDVLLKVDFLDLSAIEAFFEYYQYYYFKGGKTDLLKSDSLCSTLLNQFLILAEGKNPDRFGVVSVEYPLVVEHFKQEYGINLNPDHFARLEQKGVLCKRKTQADGQTLLQFDLKEFKTLQKIWSLLYEIEKWNEKGFVDMSDEDALIKKKKSSGNNCSQCGSQLQENAKFCSECGHKLAA